MARIIPFASGKGGVGKSTLVANLGIALAQAGKTTLIVDLDLGGSNLHTCLGIKNPGEGLSHFIYQKIDQVEDLIVSTPYSKLFLIAGDGLVPGTANIPFFIKRKLLKQIKNLVADYVLIDLGAGTTNNVLDFFLMSSLGIVVTIPETTAVLNAYSFIKSTLYRALFRSFKAKSPERQMVHQFMTEKIEGSGQGLQNLVEGLNKILPPAGDKVRQTLDHFCPGITINMGQSQNDFALGAKLHDIITKNLTTRLSFLGYLSWDEKARMAINQRSPLAVIAPQGSFSQGLNQFRDRFLSLEDHPGLELFDPEEDLDKLQGSALQNWDEES